jgi:hypothetical protein
MHQPLPRPYEVGMGTGYSDIIHRLRLPLKCHRLHSAVAAIRLAYFITDLQVTGSDPRAFVRVERMLRRRFDGFANDRQMNDNFVFVGP